MKYLRILPVTLMMIGTVPTIGAADITRSELRQLRLSPLADQNRDGRLTAEEVLRALPRAFDTNGDGRLDAAERGRALAQLRHHRLD